LLWQPEADELPVAVSIWLDRPPLAAAVALPEAALKGVALDICLSRHASSSRSDLRAQSLNHSGVPPISSKKPSGAVPEKVYSRARYGLNVLLILKPSSSVAPFRSYPRDQQLDQPVDRLAVLRLAPGQVLGE
jgi:hypothetical protein